MEFYKTTNNSEIHTHFEIFQNDTQIFAHPRNIPDTHNHKHTHKMLRCVQPENICADGIHLQNCIHMRV